MPQNLFDIKCREAFKKSRKVLFLLRRLREICEEILSHRWLITTAEWDALRCAGVNPVSDHRKEKWERGTYFPTGLLIEKCESLCRDLYVDIRFWEQFRQACIETGICKAPKKEVTLEQD